MKRPAILRRAFRRLPPVARRDRRIGDLQARLGEQRAEQAGRDRRIGDLQAQLSEQRAEQAGRDRRIADLQAQLSEQRSEQAHTASFQSRLFAERRIREHELQMEEPPPSVISNGKFWVYDLVRSHGVDVPQQFGRWDDPADIPFGKLPDRVVIKSAFGSTSRGVLPLRRSDGGWQIITHDENVTSDELIAVLRDRMSSGQIRGPFGAEEFLDGEVPGALPTDVKIYAFYGDVQMILVARSHDHGNGGAIRYREKRWAFVAAFSGSTMAGAT